jgi:hypothetical protein
MRAPLDWLLHAAIVVGPLALAPYRRRSGKGASSFPPGVLATALGMIAFAVSLGIAWASSRAFGFDLGRRGDAEGLGSAFGLFVLGPLDETLRVAAAVVPLRSKHMRRPYDAMRVSIGAAAGFVSMALAVRYWGQPVGLEDLVRGGLAGLGQVSLSSLWGYALGRERRRKPSGTAFSRAFLLAVLFSTLLSHLLWARGPRGLVAAAPLVITAVAISLVARRDLGRLGEETRSALLSRFLPVAPPSLDALRDALRRPERPMMLRWVLLGALVTIGVLTTSLTASVLLGRRLGIDFAAVDQPDSFERSVPPLVLLGLATLAAFPIAGFLVARASAARGVLEAALGATIAIASVVVLMGVAAPVAVAFGLAFAPIAFGLACAGAWAGIER